MKKRGKMRVAEVQNGNSSRGKELAPERTDIMKTIGIKTVLKMENTTTFLTRIDQQFAQAVKTDFENCMNVLQLDIYAVYQDVGVPDAVMVVLDFRNEQARQVARKVWLGQYLSPDEVEARIRQGIEGCALSFAVAGRAQVAEIVKEVFGAPEAADQLASGSPGDCVTVLSVLKDVAAICHFPIPSPPESSFPSPAQPKTQWEQDRDEIEDTASALASRINQRCNQIQEAAKILPVVFILDMLEPRCREIILEFGESPDRADDMCRRTSNGTRPIAIAYVERAKAIAVYKEMVRHMDHVKRLEIELQDGWFTIIVLYKNLDTYSRWPLLAALETPSPLLPHGTAGSNEQLAMTLPIFEYATHSAVEQDSRGHADGREGE